MGVELPLRVVVTILECCVTFSGVKLSIRSFVLFQYGELSTSQRQAVITLIEKKGWYKRLVKSWRPISLINVDTKIASKSLAIRIKEFLPQLVDCDQTAYVEGRNIGESIRLIDNLLEYADKENLDGLIFAADIEKVFDSIECNFLLATLTKYGFGSNFIQWIKTLFSNCESCVMNNGLSTGYFKLSRGTKQGDSLSPYLFILVLEILFIPVRNDLSVQGFKIGNIEIKLTAFADDTTFFVRNKESINRLLNTMRKLENFLCYIPMSKNAKIVGLGIQSVEQTSQLIVKLPPSLEVQ